MPLTLFASSMMPFPFSFRFSVPGIPNPFLAPTSITQGSWTATSETTRANSLTASRVGLEEPRRRPSPPFLVPPRPLTRKRGWVPSDSEPSRPTAISASTTGYLDTPAKYRAMASSHDNQEDEIEEMVADLPAAKRRRTLAGSIVSTALSAALIGTAVGLTVYRLWRDRGKHPEPLPPPPYEARGWIEPPQRSSTSTAKVIPPTPRSKRHRHVASRRTLPRHKKIPSRNQAYTPSRSTSPARRSPIPPESISQAPPDVQDEPVEEEEADDQMDWMGDRLARLIEEGKRALSTEVVVMSETQEDEIDDGMGGWVEDEDDLSVSRSFRGTKSRSRNPLPNYSPPSYFSPQSSPRKDRFAVPNVPRRNRGFSVDSDSHSFLGSSGHRENETSWDTPELRESMERARAMYRQQQMS